MSLICWLLGHHDRSIVERATGDDSYSLMVSSCNRCSYERIIAFDPNYYDRNGNSGIPASDDDRKECGEYHPLPCKIDKECPETDPDDEE